MTRLLDVLEDYLMYRGYKYCRIDGNTDGQFLRLYRRVQQTELGKVCVSFVYSSWWLGRIQLPQIPSFYMIPIGTHRWIYRTERRIGQKKEVSVFRFCTDNSVEESHRKAYKKLALDALVIQQGRLQQNQKSVNKEDLANSSIRAEHIFDSTAVTDLTAKCRRNYCQG